MADPISWAVTAITVVSKAAAVGTFALTGSGTLAGIVGGAVMGLGTVQGALTVAGFAASALMQPKTNVEGAPTEWRADPTAGVPFALGRVAAAGRIVHRDEWGGDNRYQSIWTVCSGAGPIQQIENFYADDVAVSFGANGAASTGAYANKMWLQTTLGASTDTALAQTGLDAASPGYEGWGSSQALPYRAACQLTLYQDSKFKSYPSGEPRTRLTLKGIKLYDPRLDSTVSGGSGSHRWGTPSTYAYSDNPALLALNWAMGLYEGSKLVGGIGAGSAGVYLPAFMEWATVCDANGWKASAYPSSLDDRHQVLLGLMQAGGARYARFAGKISCIVNAPKTSVVTLSVEDTAGPFEIATNADRLDRVNTLVPTCRMESHNWEDVPQDEISVSDYVTADGGVIDRDLSYPYVALHADGSNADQIAELAAYAILDSREPFSGTVPLKPWAMQIEPGDVFTITEPGFLLDGVELKCLNRSFDPATNIVRVTFISESDGKHDFALGRTNTPPVPATLTVPDIYDVPAPAIDVWSASPGAGKQPTILVTGSADQDNAKGFIVEYRTAVDPSTGSAWADDDDGWRVFGEYDIATEAVVLTGLEPETAYQVAVKYVSQFGVIGTRRVLGSVTTGGLKATEADTISGKTREQIDADFEEARRAAKEAGEGLIFEVSDRYYKIRSVTNLARNLFETERTERTTALLAEASTRTTQISAVNDSIAAVETTVTTLASDLTAETNTRTIQFSALGDDIAAVETSISTVASNLATETSTRTTQASQFSSSISTLTSQYNTLATAQTAQASTLTTLSATVSSQGSTLSSLSSDFTTLSASVDVLYAARIIQVSAGAGSAEIRLSAEDQNGNAASEIFLGGNTIWMNETVRFRSDGELTFFHYDGSTALTYAPWSGNMAIFKPDGTLQWNSSGGGATTEGIVARAATAPNAANTTTFGPWSVGEYNSLGNVRGWALQHLSVTLADAIGGARCGIDWDYDFSFQGKAAQFFTWWERVYLLPVSSGLPGYRQTTGLINSRLCEQGAGNVNNDSISPTAINANKWIAFPRGGSKNIILPSNAGTVPYRVVLQLCLDRDEIDHSSGNQNGILNPNGSLQYAFESCDISATVFKR